MIQRYPLVISRVGKNTQHITTHECITELNGTDLFWSFPPPALKKSILAGQSILLLSATTAADQR